MTTKCCGLSPRSARKMSITLFNAVGAIEVLSDATGLPHFKRADLGRFLGLVDVKATYRDTSTVSRKLLSNGVISPHPSQRQNDHDAFVNLEGALEIVVRSRKPKAVKLVKWLTRKGVEKVMEEHQKVMEEKQRGIDEKDMQIALLDDDLTESQEHARQLEYNNTGLQGEIRAKDQEIDRRREEVQDLIANRHVPRRWSIDTILVLRR